VWDKRAQITSVHDGDTITAVLDQGFRTTQEITVRLLGVWAPELKEVGGADCLAFVIAWVNQVKASTSAVWPFIVTTIRLKNDTKEVETLGRYVCVVTDITGSRNLNTEVQAYVASKGYGGGTGS
jgi:endonuclease YncB( thermonuclease family)